MEQTQVKEPQTEIQWWIHVLVLVVAFSTLLLRRSDLIFHPQFYAEDGHVWYSDAYNLGWWPALCRTWAGYFQTLPRLAAAMVFLLPLRLVLLFLNSLAILLQALPANLWGSTRFRILLASSYLILPNCDEVTRSITDANWALALCAFILIVCAAPLTGVQRLFDLFIVILCGMTGPFCIFLLPISLYIALRERDLWCWRLVAVLTCCSVIQASAIILQGPAARSHRILGASPELFERIAGAQVYLAALMGSNGFSRLPGRDISIGLTCVACCGTVTALYCARKASLPMKLFALLASAVFLAGLKNPFEWDHPTIPVWEVYAGIPGLRYWFFPTLAFTWLLWEGLRSRFKAVKIISSLLLCISLFGIIRDWRHSAFTESHLAQSVVEFDSAPIGTTVTFQEYPEGWTMKLVKRG